MNTIFTILKGVDTRSDNELKKIEKQTNNIAWYPSAGLDFRDLLELSNPIYTETPDLFIHTDYKPDWSLENPVFETFNIGPVQNEFNRNFNAKIDDVFELELTEPINYFVNENYVTSHKDDTPKLAKVFLLNVTVSHAGNTISKPVLYFVFENINFLEEILLKNRIKISHFVKFCEGCGFGGNRKSISIVYAFIAKLGVKYLFIDNEEHTDFELVNRIKRRHRVENCSCELSYINSINSGSGFSVNVFEVVNDNNLNAILNQISNQKNYSLKIKEYLKDQFLLDLRTMDFQQPNSTILNNPTSFRIDNNTIYFGGENWRNINNDIRNIEEGNQEFFFLSLFMITVIDLTMFTYYKASYEKFRGLTRYPKFGWVGFGPHYETPKKLLNIPENRGLIEKKAVLKYIDVYIDLFFEECDAFFKNNTPEITTADFIRKIVNDGDFQIAFPDENTIFELIYNKLKRRVYF
jgi:hypothetical protein